MNLLNSKIQFNNFEVGEFTEEQQRTYEQTIELIEKFPWEQQREKIVIDLTNPSVTMEGQDADYLKLAIYFNGRFVLHYFDKGEMLYSKSFDDKRDAYKDIQDLYNKSLGIAQFKKENTWFQHNLKHFVSQDFTYQLTNRRVRKFLWSTSGINLIAALVFVYLFLSSPIFGTHWFGVLSFVIGVLIVGGINLIVFINYLVYARKKILIMSKGRDSFYFGTLPAPTRYEKKDIKQFRVIRSRGSSSPVNGFVLVEIELKDGNVIKIPNLLIDESSLIQKLNPYPKIEGGAFRSLMI